MAHAPEVRERVRAAYIYQRLSLEIAAAQNSVAFTTAQGWKSKAAKRGDDWDKARAAAGLAAGTVDEMSQRILNEFLVQFQSTQELVSVADGIDPLSKVQAIASLADSLAKMTACLKRLLPEINRAVVAGEAINLLAEFIAAHYPQHLEIFAEILGPFSQHLAAAVNSKK